MTVEQRLEETTERLQSEGIKGLVNGITALRYAVVQHKTRIHRIEESQ